MIIIACDSARHVPEKEGGDSHRGSGRNTFLLRVG